jgi:adenylate cyclase
MTSVGCWLRYPTAGYSRLVWVDEGGTLQGLKAIRAELVNPKVAEHHGRLVKTAGDGMLFVAAV